MLQRYEKKAGLNSVCLKKMVLRNGGFNLWRFMVFFLF